MLNLSTYGSGSLCVFVAKGYGCVVFVMSLCCGWLCLGMVNSPFLYLVGTYNSGQLCWQTNNHRFFLLTNKTQQASNQRRLFVS
jgi:hypothetical protein